MFALSPFHPLFVQTVHSLHLDRPAAHKLENAPECFVESLHDVWWLVGVRSFAVSTPHTESPPYSFIELERYLSKHNRMIYNSVVSIEVSFIISQSFTFSHTSTASSIPRIPYFCEISFLNYSSDTHPT